MSLRLVIPALDADVAECVGVIGHGQWAMWRTAVRHGLSFALRDPSGRAIACGGAFELKPCLAEVWFSAHPERGRGSMAAVGLALRRALGELTRLKPHYHGLLAYVTTAEGRRIAHCLGFRFVGHRGALEVWVCRLSSARTKRPPSPGAKPPRRNVGNSPS
jgi:hypothetical protein